MNGKRISASVRLNTILIWDGFTELPKMGAVAIMPITLTRTSIKASIWLASKFKRLAILAS
tara:strand:+ start:56 stop:238 length:183 start_codon:yes stop_codon:yes gene_type:complete